MKTTLALIKRNRKLFFRDKGMLISSLITPIILIVLYGTFLANIYRDSFQSALPDFFKISDKLVDGTVASQLAAGLLAGFATGIFHTFMGIPAILAGILTQLSLYSVNLKIMGKANQAINVDKFNLLVSLRRVKGVALTQNTLFIVAIMIIILIAVLYWFFGTELGCSLRATGCNPSMSRAQGINTDRNKVLGLMLSNGLVALSGALLTQYQGFADINMGRGSIVIGLAAVIIGEAIFSRIFRNFALKLLSVVFGSILYYLVLQIVIWMGIDTDLLKMLSALVVALFLAFPYWKGKYFTKAKQGGK